MTPKIGMIVIYKHAADAKSPITEVPAIIVAVKPNDTEGRIRADLCCLLPTGPTMHNQCVCGEGGLEWHF